MSYRIVNGELVFMYNGLRMREDVFSMLFPDAYRQFLAGEITTLGV